MDITKEILMTIVKNSSNYLDGEQEILKINEQQIRIIIKEIANLTPLFNLKLLPTKDEAIVEKHNLLKEAEKRLSESDLKRTLIKGIELGFEKYHDWMISRNKKLK
tara:strand:+ start:860 stop:1177 length:318 start_codon:yes stop_codon:yes gene_type:complete